MTLVLALLLAAAPAPQVSDVPPPGSCHFGPRGEPDPHCTPGATEVDDVKALCAGSNQGRRYHPTPAFRKAMFLAYGLPWPAKGDYEIDHLIELSLGGSNSVKNLWPQLAPDYHQKDAVEAEMHRRICKPPDDPQVIPLEPAREIESVGWRAYYLGMPKPKATKKKHAAAPADLRVASP